MTSRLAAPLVTFASALLFIGCATQAPEPTTKATTRVATTAPATTRAADDRWEKDIAAFEAQDRANPMPKDAILFYGSSSVRGWRTLARDFPGLPVVNRGFGGSQMDDGVRYVDRVVIPNRPKALVLYFGDNDLAAGHTPEQVVANFTQLVNHVHAKLPETRILFLAIKPSPSRVKLLDKVKAANSAIARMADADPKLDFVDVATPMLDANGQPRAELFGPDMLHMNPAGYELWTSVLSPFLK